MSRGSFLIVVWSAHRVVIVDSAVTGFAETATLVFVEVVGFTVAPEIVEICGQSAAENSHLILL